MHIVRERRSHEGQEAANLELTNKGTLLGGVYIVESIAAPGRTSKCCSNLSETHFSRSMNIAMLLEEQSFPLLPSTEYDVFC